MVVGVKTRGDLSEMAGAIDGPGGYEGDMFTAPLASISTGDDVKPVSPQRDLHVCLVRTRA